MASSEVGELKIALTFDEKSLSSSMASAEKSASKTGDAMSVAFGTLAASAVQGLVGKVGDLASSIINAGMTFSASMSKVEAISGATAEEMVALRNKAIEMGRETRFTTTEAANALTYMGMAGWTAQQQLDGLEGVMTLAAAGGTDLALTSDIVTDALTGMGYAASDSGKLADVMAATMTSSNTDIELLGETFKYVTPLVGSLGYSMEDTALAIGLMASSSIKGSQAGTSLRSVMSRLAANTAGCRSDLEAIGVTITNTDGTMRPLVDVIEDMRTGFASLSAEEKVNLAQTVAGQEAMAGLLAIVNASPEDYDRMKQSIYNANGAAKAMYEITEDNLQGSITKLQSGLNVLATQISGSFEPALKVATDALAWLVNNLDTVLAIVTPLAAGIVAYTAVTKASAIATKTWSAVTKVAAAGQRVLNAVLNANPLGRVIAAITAVVTALGMLWANSEEFRNFVTGFFSELGNFFGWLGEKVGEVFGNIVQWFIDLPNNIGTFLSTVASNVGAWVSEMVGKAAELGGQFLGAIGQFFSQLPYNLGVFLSTAVLTVGQFGADMMAKALEIGGQFVSNIVSFFQQLPGNILAFLTQVITDVGNWTVQLGQQAVQAGTQFLQNIVNFFTQLPGKIWGFLTQAVGKAAQFVKDFAAKAVQAGTDFFNGLVNKVMEIPGKMLEIGKNIVEGIWNGISGAAGWLWEQIKNFCSGIVDGIKNFFGIHSPSTLFRDDVGVFLAQGIGLGFEEEMSDVSKEMQSSLDNTISPENNIQIGAAMPEPFTAEVEYWGKAVAQAFVDDEDDSSDADERPFELTQYFEVNSELDAQIIGNIIGEEIRRATT